MLAAHVNVPSSPSLCGYVRGGNAQSRRRKGGELADGPDHITDSQWYYGNIAVVPAYSYQQGEAHWLSCWLAQGFFLNVGMNRWMQACQQALKVIKRTALCSKRVLILPIPLRLKQMFVAQECCTELNGTILILHQTAILTLCSLSWILYGYFMTFRKSKVSLRGLSCQKSIF